MKLTEMEKRRVLDYLENGIEIAAGASYVIDHRTKKYTNIPLVALSDYEFDWTTENIYNLEVNDEIFDQKIIEKILS